MQSALHDKGLGDSTTRSDRLGAGCPLPRGAVEVKVTVTKASESPEDPKGRANVSKRSGDCHVQPQLPASQAKQPGGNIPSTKGRGDHLQGEPEKPASHVKAAPRLRRPPSASTPGKPLPAIPGTSPGKGPMSTPKSIGTSKHGKVSRTALQSDAPKSASKHQPVAESPGIITSVTIARLAAHSALPPPPLNGKLVTGLQASNGTATRTPGSKRKTPETPHQLRADSSGHALSPNPTLPPSATPSPSSSSPGTKRKKIMWDPKLLAGTVPAPQILLSDGFRLPTSERMQEGKQPAPIAQNTSLSQRSAPGAPLVQPPLHARAPAQAAGQQQQDQQEVGRPACTVRSSQAVSIIWNWGPGAAVQGRFGADLVSMAPRSVDDQRSGITVFSACTLLA